MNLDAFSYNRYSDFLKKKYGVKVYKLPVNLPATCPNRDGLLGYGGCIYCDEAGAGLEALPASFSVSEQIEAGRRKMIKMYKAEKFIAYFQSFSNTYMPLEQFKSYMEQAAGCGVVEIAVATRPDCVSEAYLSVLKEICDRHGLSATVELGLQTANYHTLEKINRGHTLAQFLDAAIRIKGYGFENCAHVILNLPWDDMTDVIETSKIISALGINHVKLHALYIPKGTELARMYANNVFEMISASEYMERVIVFLEYLSPEITLQRVIGRAPEDSAVFANWGMSWWKIHDEIQEIMKRERRFQGKHFNYLNGSVVRKFESEKV